VPKTLSKNTIFQNPGGGTCPPGFNWVRPCNFVCQILNKFIHDYEIFHKGECSPVEKLVGTSVNAGVRAPFPIYSAFPQF
jgi:hypothetical protein